MDGETMHEGGPLCVEEGCRAGHKVKDTKEGSNGIVDVQPLQDMTDTTRHATPPATSPNMHSVIVLDPRPMGNEIPEIYQDILVQTPTGERVPEHDIQWGPNPHRRVCGDTSQLLEIVPGHHHFKASYLATLLCNLVKTDLRRQFYKTPSTRESEPLWSLGKEKTMNRQKFFASRRQAWAIGDNEKIATTSPRVQVSTPGLNQNQGRPDTNDDSHGGARAQEPIHKETDVIPHGNNLFYKNGNPKPIPTARPLSRGPTRSAKEEEKETDGETVVADHPTRPPRNSTPRLPRGHRG